MITELVSLLVKLSNLADGQLVKYTEIQRSTSLKLRM